MIMRMSEKKGIMTLGTLAIIGLCCIVLVLPAAAAPQNGVYPTHGKWLTDNLTVNANNSTLYANINGVNFNNSYFFAVTGNGHYNVTDPAWNWTTDPNPKYYDRYYMEQFKVANCTPPGSPLCTDYWYPDNATYAQRYGADWHWEFIDGTDMFATIYKKGLGGYVNHCSGTYYAWYGNKTAAYMTYNNHDNWLVPTYQNATFMVNLTENWTDTAQC